MKLVQHANIVRLYEVIDTNTKLFLILELGDYDMHDFIIKHENVSCSFFFYSKAANVRLSLKEDLPPEKVRFHWTCIVVYVVVKRLCLIKKPLHGRNVTVSSLCGSSLIIFY